ncbi:DNA-binding protein [Halobacteriales archaeon SW_7_68_16]|nr:MAG: DNA-binding protein [Halobacteriales archaeon SW_7_68_16]
MSLLFESAIGAATLDDAPLFRPDGDATDPVRDDPLPLAEIVRYARNHDDLAHSDPERDWVRLPLHAPDSPHLTGEWVAYADHDLHGDIVVHRPATGDGDHEFTPLDAFARSDAGQRLRFWHPDYTPAERPDYHEGPIDEREPPRNPVDDPDALFADLRSHVRAGREARRTENRGRARRTDFETLHEAGDLATVPACSSTGQPDGRTITLRVDDSLCPERRDDRWLVRETFGLHEGGEVLVHALADDAPTAFPFRATVDATRGARIDLAVDWTAVDGRRAIGRHLRGGGAGFALTHLLNPVPTERELRGIDAVADGPFRGVLAGTVDLTFGDPAPVESDRRDVALNQEQELAVEAALAADRLCCIHGPPGTGKTRTLVEIVRRAVDAGEEVLVCADSNQAVDNLVVGSSSPGDPDERSLHAYGQHGVDEFTLRRVNAAAAASDLVRERYRSHEGLAEVVAATTNSAARLDERTVDRVVIDEATQTTLAAACIALARADTAVLAGDHRQLPPFSATEDPPESAGGLSPFTHLYGDDGVYEGVGVQLRTQYRMHPDIAWFPDRQFYDGTLRHGRAVDPVPVDRLDVVDADGSPAMRAWDVGGIERTREHSPYNETEARLAAVLVADLVGVLDPDAIGVISPYTAQVDEIERRLAAIDAPTAGVDVATVDAFQGGERTAIVVSLVRSNPDGRIGFLGRPLDGSRRLNVAMTRAERFCALLGDWETLGDPRPGTDHGVYDELFRQLRDRGQTSAVDRDIVTMQYDALQS